MVLSMRRLARTLFGGCIRQFLVCDNLGVLLIVERCIRLSQSYCLALGIRAFHRWIPSELNESDRGTRSTADRNTQLVAHLLAPSFRPSCEMF